MLKPHWTSWSRCFQDGITSCRSTCIAFRPSPAAQPPIALFDAISQKTQGSPVDVTGASSRIARAPVGRFPRSELGALKTDVGVSDRCAQRTDAWMLQSTCNVIDTR